MERSNTNIRKLKRRSLWLAHGIFYVVLFIIAALALLHTPWAKSKIETVLEDQLTDRGMNAEIEGIGGLIPLGMSLRKFTLADETGIWLEVDNAEFDVSIRNLFRFALRFQAVGAERIAIWRLPPSGEPEPPPSDKPLSLPDLPQLPETIPDLAMRKLYAGHFILGEEVLGRRIDLAFLGKATTAEEGRAALLDIDIEGRGQTALAGRLIARLGLAPSELDVELKLEETGGLVADLAKLPEIETVYVDWHGSGSLENWASKLSAQIDGIAQAEVDLGLALEDRKAISLSGHIEPAGELLPDKIAELLTSPIDLDLELVQEAPGQFALSGLSLSSDPARIVGRATIDQNAGDLEADIKVELDDLARFSGLAGTELAGTAEIRLVGGNDDPGPLLQLTVDARNVAVETSRIEAIAGQFDFAFLQPLDEGFVGTKADGELEVSGISVDGEALLEGTPLRMALESEIRPDDITVQKLVVDSDAATIEASGETRIGDGIGRFSVHGEIPALQPLLRLAKQDLPELQGAADILANVELNDGYQTIALDLELNGRELTGLPGGAEALVGAAPTGRLRTDVVLGERAEFSGLDVNTKIARITGDLVAGLDQAGEIDGTFNIDLPALAPLEAMVGQPMAGAGTIGLGLAGNISAPSVTLDARIADFSVSDQDFDVITLRANTVRLAEAPEGEVAIEVAQGDATISLASAFRLVEQRLQLENLALSGQATQIAGSLELDLTDGQAKGRLSGGITDASALRPWHGQNLTGAIDLDIQLDAENTRQNVKVNIAVPELVGDFGVLTGLDLEATIFDATGGGEIDADLTLGLFEQPDLLLRDTAVTANGRLDGLRVDLQAAGEQAGEAFNLTAGLEADVADNVKTVELHRLSGRAKGQNIRLERPANIRLDGETLNVDRLDLSIEDARIEGRLDMGGGRIDGVLEIKALPLAMLNAFGAPDIAGDASGRVSIAGATANPNIEIALLAGGIRPNDRAFLAEHGLDVELSGDIVGGSARLRAEIANLAVDAAVIDLNLPMQLALEPFGFELSNQAPLDGSVNGTIDLARIVRVLQLDGQVVQGLLTSDLRIGGTLEQPQILGETILADGLVEDSATGLSLKFMRGKLVAERERMRLEDFEARDGDGGKLRAKGEVDLRPKRKFAYGIEITSEDMRILSNELGRIYVETDMNIDGNADAGAVAGTVTLTRAEIAIPSGGGIDPVALDVTGVGENKPAEEQVAASPEATGPGYLMDLDLIIDIPAELFVRGRGLDTEWGGRLEIAGTSAEPVVTGGINYRRGFLDFLDRRFEIAEGAITFTGASPPIPEISLRAEAQGPSLLAVVSISGPATSPDLTLSSEPSRPNDEVLADLLFNRDVSEITPVQAIRLANAVRTLEGGGVDTMGNVRDAIGVDTLDIGGESPEDASAKVGKYVADGVFLELERGLSSGKSTARVEVELTDNISVNTEVSDDSQAGVGLEWSLDY